MIYENNEEKRSTLWRTVLTVSSVLIIIIAVFFVVKLFTANPLEGKCKLILHRVSPEDQGSLSAGQTSLLRPVLSYGHTQGNARDHV